MENGDIRPTELFALSGGLKKILADVRNQSTHPQELPLSLC
jgi:hypothetical protein